MIQQLNNNTGGSGRGVMQHTLLHQLLADLREASLFNLGNSFLRVELAGRSKETVTWYRNRLLALVEYLGPDRSLSDIQEPDLLIWHAWITSDGRGLSKDTQRGHIRACKRLFAWVAEMSDLPDISRRLVLPPAKKYARRGISDTNYSRILEAAKESPRDYALLMFLGSSGARRGGVAGLRLGDLDLDNLRAYVVEKGAVERPVFLTEEAAQALEAWLAVRPQCADDHVFLGHSPGQDWSALRERGISSIITRYKRRLGLQGSCSPHQFRHRLGRRMAERGMTLGTLAQIMGHQDPRVTVLHYGGFSTDELQDAYEDTINKPTRRRRSR